jgi:hypothetical protein
MMNGLELLRLGLAPQMRRHPDGVFREIRREPRQVRWTEVVRALKAQTEAKEVAR